VNIIHYDIDYIFSNEDQLGREKIFYELDVTMFIFVNLSWDSITKNLLKGKIDKHAKFTFTGGSLTKRHILSPLQYKFGMFLSMLGVTRNHVSLSYNYMKREVIRANYKNINNTLNKIGKKEFHTWSTRLVGVGRGF
jgi:hypothetical protein